MRVDQFDFELPQERIALRPARPRDSARLLLVEGERISDKAVRDLQQILRRGDVLVFNDTRVIPAQLEGRRGEASIGATLHKREGLRGWWAFVRNAKRLKPGDRIDFGAGVAASVIEKAEEGSALLHFHGEEPVELLLERAGRMPLPPYIAGKRPADEADDEVVVVHVEPVAREAHVVGRSASPYARPRTLCSRITSPCSRGERRAKAPARRSGYQTAHGHAGFSTVRRGRRNSHSSRSGSKPDA